MKDPARLSEGSDELAALLRDARADLPKESELAQVATELSKLSPVATGGAGAGAAAAAGVGGGKVVAVLVIACGIFAASIYGIIKTARPRLAPAVPIVSQTRTTVQEAPSAAASKTTAPVIESSAPATAEAASAPPPLGAKRAPPSESQLLDAARAALASSPDRALALARRHAQLYPKGVLVQEREVIAIEALKRKGSKTAAQERAAGFERKFPNSPHKNKIEKLQGSGP